MNKVMSESQIVSLVSWLAAKLVENCEITIVAPIMNGAYFFGSDLLRHMERINREGIFNREDIDQSFKLEPIRAKRNRTADPNAFSELIGDLSKFKGEDVLVVDTIFDTGGTAMAVQYWLKNHVRSLTWCFLLARGKRAPIMETGRTIVGRMLGDNDEYLIGYGLDRNDYDRGLASIYSIPRSKEVPDSLLNRGDADDRC